MDYQKELDKLTNEIKYLCKKMFEHKNIFICKVCKEKISHNLDLINRITCPFCYTKI